jgi:hypothetical protein
VADDETSATTPAGAVLEPGQRVEVRSGFDGSWRDGFVVGEVTATGYRLRRDGDPDGSLLPEIGPELVRRPRRRDMWWF